MPSARLAMAAAAARAHRRDRPDCDICSMRGAQVGQRGKRGAVSLDQRIGGIGGQRIFEFGVEAVLRLAGLQIEEAEDERAGEAEQR